ncbi:MAG: hypothetical protein LW697_14200, partial [Blastopirellula sp.]|nr:hypothetical protein [Blastopirellula sp.]
MQSTQFSRLLGLFLACSLSLILAESSWAQGKRSAGHAGGISGARPSMNRGGGMPGGMSRPSPAAMSRPSPAAMSRPSPGVGASRPNLPQTRPNVPQ